MRVQGYDEELGEYTDELANIDGELINLTKTAENAQGISVFTDETQSEYKSMGAYLREIAMVYDDLSASAQVDLLDKLFGKNRASVGAAIIRNIEAYDEALENMARSAGTAEKEVAIAQESISYHLNELSQTWVGIAQKTFQSDLIIGFVDALTVLSETVENLIDTFGPLPTLIGAVTGGMSLFGKGELIISSIF